MMDILTCIFLSILMMVASGFTVHGPAGPLVAPLGSSVVLPCYVDVLLSMEDLEVEWRRTNSETLVHLLLNGESLPEVQEQDYHDRAHFFTDQIQHGNFSLRLDNLTAEDEGAYICTVHSQQDSGETVVQIKHERLLVSGSDQSVFAYDGEDITMNCSVDSHIPLEDIEVSWIRTDGDILVLLYQNNETIAEAADEQYRDRVEFFTAEIPKGNFSLKLKSVRTEDKGVYMCRVFAGELSANATAVLEQLGFSTFHITVLVFCIAAGFGAVVLLCSLIICKSKKTVTSRTIWNLQLSLVFCPNICMFLAFIFWGFTEGFLNETITCCALYILRPVMLIWALTYLKYIQGHHKTWIRFSRIIGEYAVLTIIVYSVIFTYGWKNSTHHTNSVVRILFVPCFGFVVLYCLIMCGGFRSIKVIRTCCFLVSAPQSIQLSFSLRPTSPVLIILPWFQVILVLTWLLLASRLKDKICKNRTNHIVMLLDMIMALYVHLGTLKTEKDYFGWTCVVLFLQVLRLMVYFDQQGSNPVHLGNEIIYMFGAVGLVLLNSVTLTAELILKARNGERAVKDLRVIVFSSECVFALYWLVLQIHSFCNNDNESTHNQRNSLQRQRHHLMTTPETREMENLSTPCPTVLQRQK